MGIFINENGYDEEFTLQENAQFHILPKFKLLMDRYPELGKYQTQLKNIEEMFAKLGKDSPVSVLNKFLMLLIRFESTLTEWVSIAYVIIPISGWILLPMVRVISWLWDTGAFELAKSNTNKMINELEKIKSQTKDAKVKKHCDEQIKKLKDTLNDLNKNKKFKFTMDESANYFAMMEADDIETDAEIDKVAAAGSEDDDDTDVTEATKEFFDMLNSIREGDGCGECPDDDDEDITDDDEVSVDVEVDEFYAEESCKSSKKKSKKKAVKEDDAEDDEDSDDDDDVEDSVEEGAFRDDFYDSDAEAAAAIHNNVTEEFFATLAAIKEEQ